jgi:hypothetical protein
MEDEPARSSPTSILNELLREDSCWIRALAVRSVQELGIRELIPVLAELRTDPDPLVHEAAQAALVHFAEVGPMNTLQTVSILERVLLLRDIPIFSELLPEDLQQIALTAREMWFPGNSVLAREGEQGDTLFIVVEGELAVLRQQDGLDRVIAKRGPGDFVGESAIIDVAPRSATLLTHTDVRVLAIDGETFKGILTERPAVAMAVLRSLSRRLRELTP